MNRRQQEGVLVVWSPYVVDWPQNKEIRYRGDDKGRERWLQTVREAAERDRLEEERRYRKAREKWEERRAEEARREQEYLMRREERRRQRAARQAEIDEQDRLRKEKHAALEAAFIAAGSRERWVAIERASGRTLKSIGDQMGLSKDRVRDLQARYESKLATGRSRWKASRLNLGRPIDMGGPRDVWIEDRITRM